MLQEMKSGLRAHLSPSFTKPDWMSQSAKSFPILKKLLDTWSRADIPQSPVFAYLLEEHVEQFCLEAIWYHMQVASEKHWWDIL